MVGIFTYHTLRKTRIQIIHPAVADLGAGAKGPWPPPLPDITPTSDSISYYLSLGKCQQAHAKPWAASRGLAWAAWRVPPLKRHSHPLKQCPDPPQRHLSTVYNAIWSTGLVKTWMGAKQWDPFMDALLGARIRNWKLGLIHGGIPGGQFIGALLGAMCQKVGSLHGFIIGGQGPKRGVTSWGPYWGPGSEKWGHFMGSLLGARVRNVGSLHGVIIGGQGPKRGVTSWGHYWGPSSEKFGPFMGSVFGARVWKMGCLHGTTVWA